MFSMKSIKKRILGFSNSENGFTLIEIIAVLVILGILAAVALPKFKNLQDDARNKAAASAIAEAKARLSQTFASWLLSNNGNAAAITTSNLSTEASSEAWGDFTVVLGSDDPITINVTQVQNVATTQAAFNRSTWNMPSF